MGESQGSTQNHYTVLGRLAGGGMADIFLARASSEGGVERFVVLKRVISERSRDPAFAQMFLDEARLAAQLHHPNIAQVHDIGRIAGSYFFTMEYVHGEDVQTVLERLAAERRALPVNLALYIAAGALSALQHAHERRGSNGQSLGIVHRDVSPSNVMISFEGSIKLLDFGVAKAVQRTAESNTGTLKGKIAYMSPEQCQSGTIDRRSDVFGLGIVLYEMLTGQRLFRRETDFNTMIAITTEEVPPPSTLRPEISPAVDAIVLKALSKPIEGRFASAAEMLEAIEEVATREHLTLSGTATGRFMHRIFGDKPEPWLALQKETQKHVTLQGESQFDPISAPIGTSPGEILANERVLEQLYRTPTLHGARVATAEGSTMNLKTPVDSSALLTMPLRAVRPDSDVPAAPRRSKLALIIGLGALVAVAAAVVVVTTRGGDRSIEVKSAPPSKPAAVTPDAATAAATPDAAPAITPDAEIAQAPPEPAKPAAKPLPKRPAKPVTTPTAKPDPCETNPLKCRE